ncbi:MAG: diaminopimelate decarboxylase, partial [Oscillospiraceae bacterium]|nr:diaminopimelate decarboxylase [Oscillospiraceae bacterium]
MKKPFVTLEKLREIAREIPTPFHLYDEAGIVDNAGRIKRAFAWNPGFREFFAVKATPTPAILKLLGAAGFGVDCASMTELLMSERCGFTGGDIMFSSNATPDAEFVEAARLGAIINLDDITHIEVLQRLAGIPKKLSCRFNPGGTFEIANRIMDNPGDAKYGMTRPQMFEAFTRLRALGAEEIGIHAFLASNAVSNEYYPQLAAQLFELAAELRRETGARVPFVNLSGGVGIPYRPEQEPNDIAAIGEGVRRA